VETFAAMVRGLAATMSKRLPVSLQRAARGMSGPERESLSAIGSFRGWAGQGVTRDPAMPAGPTKINKLNSLCRALRHERHY